MNTGVESAEFGDYEKTPWESRTSVCGKGKEKKVFTWRKPRESLRVICSSQCRVLSHRSFLHKASRCSPMRNLTPRGPKESLPRDIRLIVPHQIPSDPIILHLSPWATTEVSTNPGHLGANYRTNYSFDHSSHSRMSQKSLPMMEVGRAGRSRRASLPFQIGPEL